MSDFNLRLNINNLYYERIYKLQQLILALENGDPCPIIDLSNTSIDTNTAAILIARIPDCHLTKLKFDFTKLEDDDTLADIIAAAAKSTTLTNFKLFNMPINQKVNQSIINLVSSKELTVIDLVNIVDNDTMMEVLRIISAQRSIKSLSLAMCNMDEKFTPWIIDVIHSNTNMKTLDISNNPLGNSIYQIAKVLAYNESIKNFIAEETELSYEVCIQIIEILQNNYTLKYVTLIQGAWSGDEEKEDDAIILKQLDQLLERNKKNNCERHFKSTKCILNNF